VVTAAASAGATSTAAVDPGPPPGPNTDVTLGTTSFRITSDYGPERQLLRATTGEPWVAHYGWGGRLLVRNVESGKTVVVLPAAQPASYTHKRRPFRFAVSPDGRLFAQGCGPTWLHGVEGQQRLARLEVKPPPKPKPKPRPKPRRTARGSGGLSGGRGGAAVRGGAIAYRRPRVTNGACAIFTPDGGEVATADSMGLHFWNASSFKLRGTVKQLPSSYDALAYSPDGKQLAGIARGQVYVVDSGTLKVKSTHPTTAKSVGFLPDGRLLLGTKGRLELFDPTSAQATERIAGEANETYSALAVAPDGKSADAAGTQRIDRFDLTKSSRVDGPPRHTAEVVSVAELRELDALVTASKDGTIRFWNDATGAPLAVWQAGGAVDDLAVAPDDSKIAAIVAGDLKIWRAGSLTQPGPLQVIEMGGKAHDNWARRLAFSPDGTELATAHRDAGLDVYSVTTGKESHHLYTRHSGTQTLAFSPDGQQLLSAAPWSDATVRVFDLDKDRLHRELDGHDAGIHSLAYSTNQLIASGGRDRVIRIWDGPSGRLLRAWRAHLDYVSLLVFAPDGGRLASSDGGPVTIWDVVAGVRHVSGPRHADEITKLSWTRDGRRLLSASEDGTARAWPVPALKVPGRAPPSRQLEPARVTARCQRAKAPPARAKSGPFGRQPISHFGLGSLSVGMGKPITSAMPTGVDWSGYRDIAMGPDGWCAIHRSGMVHCDGQRATLLGQGRGAKVRPRPLAVLGLRGALQLAVGGSHACARHRGGAIYCWGDHDSGQIGDGTHGYDRHSAQRVNGMDEAVDLAAGARHSCAALANGLVACWGENGSGQLGDGSKKQRREPSAVCGIADGIAVAAGDNHSCALRRNGTVSCWGAAEQLGSQRSAASPLPLLVPKLSKVVQVVAGARHSCALDSRGEAWCWGSGTDGQLGQGAKHTSLTPVAVKGLKDARALTAGEAHTCAMLADGGIRCWGANSEGQLGDGTTTERLTPTEVTSLEGASTVTAAGSRTCALVGDELQCWGLKGYDYSSSLASMGGLRGSSFGTPTKPRKIFSAVVPRSTAARLAQRPRAVPGLSEVVSLTSGPGSQCAVRRDGTVWCWGEGGPVSGNRRSQLPRKIPKLRDVVQLAVGISDWCAVIQDGTLRCWGNFPTGPKLESKWFDWDPIPGLRGVIQVAVDDSTTCAVLKSGAVRCWGWNTNGEIGDGTTDRRPRPVAVHGLGDAISIGVGGSQTCALRKTGVVSCWGSIDEQDGQGMPVETLKPKDRTAQGDAHFLVKDGWLACSIHAQGRLSCWSYGSHPDVPFTGLGGLTNVTQLAFGSDHGCVVQSGGQVLCWGKNDYGQLGDGGWFGRADPRPVLGLSDATQVSAGSNHSCALRRDGTVLCWGDL